MKGAAAVTPAREQKLRRLDWIAEQLRQQALSVGETISRRHDERRHADENVWKLEQAVEAIERDQRYAPASERKRLSDERAKAQERLKHERARAEFLQEEVAELARQQQVAQEAWGRCRGIVDAVLGTFGPAGQDVRARLRGKA